MDSLEQWNDALVGAGITPTADLVGKLVVYTMFTDEDSRMQYLQAKGLSRNGLFDAALVALGLRQLGAHGTE